MATQNPLLPHLQLLDRGFSQDYKSRGGGGKPPPLPARVRATHGSALRQQLEDFAAIEEARKAARAANNLQQGAEGITIEFRSANGFELAFKSLDLPSSGIELLNVRIVNGVTYATCYVPDGKLRILANKVRLYLEPVAEGKKPKNQTLIDSIESIGLATFDALWTDESAPPDDQVLRAWEVWLRLDAQNASAAVLRFIAAAEPLEITVSQQWIEFPGRVVVVVQATRGQLTTAIELLNLIAEIRHADISTALPHDATICEQDAFVDELAARIVLGDDSVAISLLDTGVSRLHPLIGPLLAAGDMHSVHPDWSRNDHQGHGTNMAGLAVYGNMNDMSGNGPITVPYRLESVTTLAPAGAAPLAEPFGAITQQAVSYCEIAAPHRKRVICKAITTQSSATGEPSSYSGAIDMSAFADGGEESRLYVISAGNTPDMHWLDSPNSNLSYGIERPGQAWNALTVGAYTQLQALPGSADYAGWQSIAEPGGLSPFSATSALWGRWPIKPEVLFEGGNAAKDPAGIDVGTPNTLQLLTTRTGARPLGYTSMTSAAAAQAARLAATVQAEYLDYWPETVRGLIVHNAEWTAAQREQFVTDEKQASRLLLLRSCGYGAPQQERTIFSARNRVSIVAQEVIQPFRKEESEGKMNKCRIFALPWPKEMLYGLAEQPVRLKVTLSYFVEPSPGKRGWLNRYRYASHGLRFDLRRNNESVDVFNKRVNAALRAKDEELDAPDDEGWFLGSQLRSYGSIHSDQWTGMAINLANRDLIAVYPVIGWWRENPRHEHCEMEARFSLIFSLESGDTNLDLYSAVQAELAIPLSAELTNVLEPGA
jgi:hypothetical protein